VIAVEGPFRQLHGSLTVAAAMVLINVCSFAHSGGNSLLSLLFNMLPAGELAWLIDS
jgi:hypothetical protein